MSDFDLRALYEAMDAQRRERGLTWTAAVRQINRRETKGHPVSTATVTGVGTTAVAEGDGVLQMLRWLGRSPESFIPAFPDADAARFRLPAALDSQALRWDARTLHAALEARRAERALTWAEAAREIGGVSGAMLTYLAQGGRVGFPGVMRLVRWLDQPAADFIRVVDGPTSL